MMIPTHKIGILDVVMQLVSGSNHSPAKIANTVNNDPPNVKNDHLKLEKRKLHTQMQYMCAYTIILYIFLKKVMQCILNILELFFKNSSKFDK